MASDFTKDGKYLEKGIYMEATALSFTGGRGDTWHSYLVYRDGEGNAEVIRGGFNLSDYNLDLEVQTGIKLNDSKDAYYLSNKITYFDQNTHIYTKLNVGDRPLEKVWEEMKEGASKIDTNIDYNAFVTDKPIKDIALEALKGEQISLGKDAVVCHSITGAVMSYAGISIDDAIKRMDEVTSKHTITEEDFTGIRTDIINDGHRLNRDILRVEERITTIRDAAKSIEQTTIDALGKIQEIRQKTFDNVNKAIKNVQTELDNLKVETSHKIDEIKDNFENLFSVNDTEDKTNLSLEQLVANELGYDVLSKGKLDSKAELAEAYKNTQETFVNQNSKDENNDLQQHNA